VIDSIAVHFRQGFTDMAQRSRMLSFAAQQLSRLANDYNLAVVLTNQMTTKMNKASSSDALQQSTVVPALGTSMAFVTW
jgi:RAD51-like protein 2